MKKVFSFLAVLALALVCGGGSAFSTTLNETTTGLTPKQAIATFADSGTIEFSADLYTWTGNYDTRTSTTQITWTTTGITLGSSSVQWKNADVYCLVSSTITTKGGVVYIYTDNKNNSAPYTAQTSQSNYFNGLIRADSNGGAAKNFAPIKCWYSALSTAKTDYNTAQPVINDSSPSYNTRNLNDIGTVSPAEYPFVPAQNVMSNKDGNFVGTPASGYDFTTEDVVIFFGAGFTNVLGGDSFGTTTINFSTIAE